MYLQVKKDTKYLTRKINQLIACTNAEIERGRGGKRFFPPTKEIGTREGDRSGKGKYFPYCKWNRFFICGGKYCQNRRQKNAPSKFKGKSTEKLTRQKPVLSHKAREKGASDVQKNSSSKVKNFFAQPARPVGQKNVILCFLANMRYIRDGICTGHIRRRVYVSVPAG